MESQFNRTTGKFEDRAAEIGHALLQNDFVSVFMMIRSKKKLFLDSMKKNIQDGSIQEQIRHFYLLAGMVEMMHYMQKQESFRDQNGIRQMSSLMYRTTEQLRILHLKMVFILPKWQKEKLKNTNQI